MTSTPNPLAWVKADFIRNNEEIPAKLLHDDVHTEGELMDRPEIDQWIKDSYATFCLIQEAKPQRFDELYNEFTADVKYLEKHGKITEDEAHSLLNKDLYTF